MRRKWLTTAEAADTLCISVSCLRGPLIDVAIARQRPKDPRDGILWLREDVERVLHIRQAARLGFASALRVAAALRAGLIASKNDTTRARADTTIHAASHGMVQ
jgi:hypothetical protein